MSVQVLSLEIDENAEHWSSRSLLQKLPCLGTLRILRISAICFEHKPDTDTLLPDLNAMSRLTAMHLYELGFSATHPLLPARLPASLRSLQIYHTPRTFEPDDGTLPEAFAQRLTGLTALCAVVSRWQCGLPQSLCRLNLHLEDSWALSSDAPSMISAFRGLSCLQALVLQDSCGDAWPAAVRLLKAPLSWGYMLLIRNVHQPKLCVLFSQYV